MSRKIAATGRNLAHELMQGLTEARKFVPGQVNPQSYRQTRVRVDRVPDVDVKQVRERLGLSQTQFAGRLGPTTSTVQNWEQGRRRPQGPARVLLVIISKHPEVIDEMLS